jgi:hypothetical protein
VNDLIPVCKHAVQSFEGAIACGVFPLDGGAPLAYFVGDPEKQAPCDAFVALARELLGERGQQEMAEFSKNPASTAGHGEVHLAGDVYGYARTLPVPRVFVALVSTPSYNVGVGWATLSIASTRISAML